MDDHMAWRGRGVDILGQGLEARTKYADRFHYIQKVAQGTDEVIILGDDEHVAAPLVKQPAQLWRPSGSVADRIGKHPLYPRSWSKH